MTLHPYFASISPTAFVMICTMIAGVVCTRKFINKIAEVAGAILKADMG